MTTKLYSPRQMVEMAKACQIKGVEPDAIPLRSAIMLIEEAFKQGKYTQLEQECARLEAQIKYWRKYAQTFTIPDRSGDT